MVAAPTNFRGDLKISDQNNWGWGGWGGGRPEKKIKFRGGELNFRGAMNPNDVMVVVLKDILLC